VSEETALLDLPPAPPAFVEVRQDFSIPASKEILAVLNGGDHEPPEPPRDHEHSEEGPRSHRLPLGSGHYTVTGNDVDLKPASSGV